MRVMHCVMHACDAQIKVLIRSNKKPTPKSTEAFKQLAIKYPKVALIKEQHHGQWVHVPAGWLHMVRVLVHACMRACVHAYTKTKGAGPDLHLLRVPCPRVRPAGVERPRVHQGGVGLCAPQPLPAVLGAQRSGGGAGGAHPRCPAERDRRPHRQGLGQLRRPLRRHPSLVPHDSRGPEAGQGEPPPRTRPGTTGSPRRSAEGARPLRIPLG